MVSERWEGGTEGRGRTEVKGHAEVGEACCGQNDGRDLVEEPDASRPLRVAHRQSVPFFLLLAAFAGEAGG